MMNKAGNAPHPWVLHITIPVMSFFIMVLLFAGHDVCSHRVLLEICIIDNNRVLSEPSCCLHLPALQVCRSILPNLIPRNFSCAGITLIKGSDTSGCISARKKTLPLPEPAEYVPDFWGKANGLPRRAYHSTSENLANSACADNPSYS